MKKTILSLVAVSVLFLAGCNNDSPTEQKIVEHVTANSIEIPDSVKTDIEAGTTRNASKDDEETIKTFLDESSQTISPALVEAIKTAPLPSESRDTSYEDLQKYSEEMATEFLKLNQEIQAGKESSSISFIRTPGKITNIPNAKGVELTIPLISINAIITQKQSLPPQVSTKADIKTASSIYISDLKEFSNEDSPFKNLKISEEISNSMNMTTTVTINPDNPQESALSNTGKVLYNTAYTLGCIFVVPADDINIAGKLVGEITIKLNIDDLSKTSDIDYMANLTNPNFELYETLPQEYFEISKIKFIVYDLNGNELFTYKEINSISDFSEDPFAQNVLKNLIDFQNSIINPDSTTEE
ncbi:MAG: hypothetical protein ACI4LT_10995 [Treponema sp.]